jgi:polysaccharide export outer membrane protein
MFTADEATRASQMQQQAAITEKTYLIQPNDYLSLEVFSNKGERIIDPNAELLKETGNINQANVRPKLTYLVNPDGTAKFPMVDLVKVDNLSLLEAEKILQQKYNEFYKDCFVSLRFENKRVILLGATGGQVIPLVNQNVTLVEALALAKGLNNDAKADNIKVIRGDQVFFIDMSTIEGYRAGNLIVQPGDIIYVEPIRRPLVEAFKDYSIVASIFLSLASIVIVLVSQN